jgi:sRNA-binding protein
MDGMTSAGETETRSPQSTIRRPAARRSPWPPWMAAILADWRRRWPAVFTRPVVPLAIGISRDIKATLRAEGTAIGHKSITVTLRRWTTRGPYLRAVARGEMRRNLDGSEAGVPDDAARQYAQRLLEERAAWQAEREREQAESEREQAESERAAADAGADPLAEAHTAGPPPS